MSKTIISTGIVQENGTKVRSIDKLDSTEGILVNPSHINARRPSAEGVIVGIVPGHGGEVYYVSHGEEFMPAVYMEHELYLIDD